MKKITKAVIPAAGLGTRFLPATKAQPKEMMPILDKPTLQYIVEEAAASGITDILVIIGRGKESIVNHFDRSLEVEEQLTKSGNTEILEEIRGISEIANLFYVRQREAKGLGHAIACAEAFAKGEPFAVLLGDDVLISETPITKQLIDVYEKTESSVVALVDVPDDQVHKYGIIEGEKVQDDLYKITNLVEKPSLAEAPSRQAIIGRYVIMPEIFDILRNTKPGKNNEIQLTDALLELSRSQEMYGLRFEGDRHDIGSKFGFVKANIEFGLKDSDIGPDLKKYIEELDLEKF